MATTPTLTPEQIEALIKRNQELETENQQASQIIADQADQLKTAEARTAGTAPVVTHDGKQYRVIAPKFQFKSKDKDLVLSADQLQDHPEVIAALVTSESDLLVLIEAPVEAKK